MATRLGGDVAERRDQGCRHDQERGQKKRDGEGQAHAITLARGGHVTWPPAYRDMCGRGSIGTTITSKS